MVRPGRLMVSRMLNFLRTMEGQGVYQIPYPFKLDAKWWLRFLPEFNGIAMFPPEQWESPDTVFATDACLQACGGVCGDQYFHEMFPQPILDASNSINGLELCAVMVAIKLWGPRFRGRRVKIFCDNLVSVMVLNTNRTRVEFMQDCLREILFVAAVYEFEIRAVHLASKENRLPDLLSRWHLGHEFRSEFHKLSKPSMYRVRIDPNMFEFLNVW